MTYYSRYPIKIEDKIYLSISLALARHPRQDIMRWLKDNAGEIWNQAGARPLLENNPAETYRRLAAQELEIVFGKPLEKPTAMLIALMEEYIKTEDWLDITKESSLDKEYTIKLIEYIWSKYV